MLLGALETITSLVIIRWYCDMIVFFECSYLSTFGTWLRYISSIGGKLTCS
jgi:hypothetical protein